MYRVGQLQANPTFNKKLTRDRFKPRVKRRRCAVEDNDGGDGGWCRFCRLVRYTCGISCEKKPLVGRVPPKLQNYYSSWNTMTRVSLACIKETVQGERWERKHIGRYELKKNKTEGRADAEESTRVFLRTLGPLFAHNRIMSFDQVNGTRARVNERSVRPLMLYAPDRVPAT